VFIKLFQSTSMSNTIIGTLPSRDAAEALLKELTEQLGIPREEISFVYRSLEGNTHGGDTTTVGTVSTSDGEGTATGAVVGGSVGALAGIATVMGVIPVIGPIFAAGPLLAAIGLGVGAAGTVAAGALTGALAGGVIGFLTDLGAPEGVAIQYEERLKGGEVLVAVQREDVHEVERAFRSHGATSVDIFQAA